MNRAVRGGMIPLILLGWLILNSCGQTNVSGSKIVGGETISLASKHLQREMIVDLYLPDGYARAD